MTSGFCQDLTVSACPHLSSKLDLVGATLFEPGLPMSLKNIYGSKRGHAKTKYAMGVFSSHLIQQEHKKPIDQPSHFSLHTLSLNVVDDSKPN